MKEYMTVLLHQCMHANSLINIYQNHAALSVFIIDFSCVIDLANSDGKLKAIDTLVTNSNVYTGEMQTHHLTRQTVIYSNTAFYKLIHVSTAVIGFMLKVEYCIIWVLMLLPMYKTTKWLPVLLLPSGHCHSVLHHLVTAAAVLCF